MKLDDTDTDPPRVVEGQDTELARLVRASRMRRLSSRTTAQMVERLAATSAYAAAARASSTRPSLLGRVGGTKLVALALVGLGVGIFGWQARNVEQAAAPPSEVAVQSAAPTPASPPSLSPPAVEVAPTPVEALPSSATAAVVASTPHRAVAPRPPSSAVVVSTSTEARTPPSRENEFALVRRAQDALVSDPARTLILVQEHARAFPTGELVQEREVLAVEALARLSRMAEARERADALRALYPRTPYGARLDRALGLGPGEGSSPVAPSNSLY